MICKVYLKPKKGSEYPIIPIVNQSDLNSFIYRLLGDNNQYHDVFSEYSISSIQGGKLYDGKYLKFEEEPYVQVCSEDVDFVNTLLNGLNVNKYEFFNMVFDRVEVDNFDIWKKYDKVITISPVIVYDENRNQISCKDERFIECLKKNCLDKLRHHNINDGSFDIELLNPDKGKVKRVLVGKRLNIASMCLFKISGRVKSRECLYNLGLGGSTGSGFGAVKLYTR